MRDVSGLLLDDGESVHYLSHTRRLLDVARTRTDEQLDSPLKNQVKIFPWNGADQREQNRT
jgi:hypothetical protein